jgi:3-hydroxybutyryl-CoA dehydrogenase
MDIKNVTIIGAGTMGHGIGLTYALAGCRVTLQDMNVEIMDKAIARVTSDLATFAECGIINRDMIPKTLANITTTTDLKESVKNADFVTEAVTEKAEVKRAIFRDLDDFCPERTILASNTSSLVLGDFTDHCRRKDRLLITHWVNPPHIAPVVEVVRGQDTSAETVEIIYSFLKRAGKTPVIIRKGVPGLVHNRIQAAMIREVWALWEQGVASAEDIDLVVNGGFGLRLASNGPLATCDLGGLDVWYASMGYLFNKVSDAKEPPARLAEMVKAGDLGVKSGRGFFDYHDAAIDQSQSVKERDKLLISILKLRGDIG